MTDDNQRYNRMNRFLGFVLMTAALLWIAFCGLCAFSLLSGVGNGAEIGTVLFVLALSGGGAAAGYGVFVAGRNIWNTK